MVDENAGMGRRGHRTDCPRGTDKGAACVCRGRKSIFGSRMRLVVRAILPDELYAGVQKRIGELCVLKSVYVRNLIEADLKKHASAKKGGKQR
jgi:hypothetical protein